MPAAVGWGAAQEANPSPPEAVCIANPALGVQLHRQLSPSGASLLPYCSPCSLSADHCLLNAFKLQNLLSLFCCSSTQTTVA